MFAKIGSGQNRTDGKLTQKWVFFCVSKRTQREQKASVLPQWHYSAQSFCEPNLPTHTKSGAKVDYFTLIITN